MSRLVALTPGQQIVFGGDQVVEVEAELADAFQAGDRLVVVQEDGALLHIPANEYAIVDAAVTAAQAGFAELAAATDDAISDFFESSLALSRASVLSSAEACLAAEADVNAFG